MMHYIKIAFLSLLIFSCSKPDCPQETSAVAMHYIILESGEGDRFCLPYSGLRYVTKSDSLSLTEGKREREELACGINKLNNKDFENIVNLSHLPVYKINGIGKREVVELTDRIMDSSGVFSLRDIEFNYRGDVILDAIQRGFEISLAKDKTESYWRKK